MNAISCRIAEAYNTLTQNFRNMAFFGSFDIDDYTLYSMKG